MNKEERLTEECWKNLDPWECCGQDYYCKRGLREKGGCINGCIVPRNYSRLAKYEDTGLSPAEIKELQAEIKELQAEADTVIGGWIETNEKE